MGELRYLNKEGDQRVMWDKSNKDEVDVAKMTFDKLKAKGYQAWSVNKDGSKNKLITKFDPKAGKIIMTPAVTGG